MRKLASVIGARWLAVKRRIKQSHWIFGLGDVVLVRLQMQDGQRRDLDEMARQHVELVKLVRDLRTRLKHHERGPLQASREEWDRRSSDGVVLPIKAKRNGRRSDIGKRIDARGQVTDAPHTSEEPPPPAEAAGDDGDESA